MSQKPANVTSVMKKLLSLSARMSCAFVLPSKVQLESNSPSQLYTSLHHRYFWCCFPEMQLHLAEIRAGLWKYVWPCHGSIPVTLSKDHILARVFVYWSWTRSSLMCFQGFSYINLLMVKERKAISFTKLRNCYQLQKIPSVSQASGSVMKTHSSACTSGF